MIHVLDDTDSIIARAAFRPEFFNRISQ